MTEDLFKPEDYHVVADEETALQQAAAYELELEEREWERCRYHEAGHIAACLALGIRIVKARAAIGGCVSITPQSPDNNKDALILYAAGAAAEMRMPGADASIRQPRLDIEMAGRFLGGDWTWEDAATEAGRLVSANWALVEWIVEAFRRDGEYLSEVTLAHINERVVLSRKGDAR